MTRRQTYHPNLKGYATVTNNLLSFVRYSLAVAALFFLATPAYSVEKHLDFEPKIKGMITIPATEIEKIRDTWGIEVVGLRRTAANYMLDFRYKVVDEEKSKQLFSKRHQPYAIYERNGGILTVPSAPKIGSLRQETYENKVGKTFFILFANPAGLVKAGETVSVGVGKFKITGLVAQ